MSVDRETDKESDSKTPNQYILNGHLYSRTIVLAAWRSLLSSSTLGCGGSQPASLKDVRRVSKTITNQTVP